MVYIYGSGQPYLYVCKHLLCVCVCACELVSCAAPMCIPPYPPTKQACLA